MCAATGSIANEASHSNFAATGTTNYMTISSHHSFAETSSSQSSNSFQQCNSREGNDEKNGNGSSSSHQDDGSLKKKTAQMLRNRRAIIVKQRKQIATLQVDLELVKRVLSQMDDDGLLTPEYKRSLEVKCKANIRVVSGEGG